MSFRQGSVWPTDGLLNSFGYYSFFIKKEQQTLMRYEFCVNLPIVLSGKIEQYSMVKKLKFS